MSESPELKIVPTYRMIHLNHQQYPLVSGEVGHHFKAKIKPHFWIQQKQIWLHLFCRKFADITTIEDHEGYEKLWKL